MVINKKINGLTHTITNIKKRKVMDDLRMNLIINGISKGVLIVFVHYYFPELH